MITQALVARGDLPAIAQTKAIGFLNGIVTKQAMMLSFEQLFLLFGIAFVLSLPLLLLMHRSKGGPGGAAAH
jgi:DHA2 family multidrug resistance protein